MWNTTSFMNEGTTLVATSSKPYMSPNSVIQYYKEDYLPFENTSSNSFFVHNLNNSSNNNTHSSTSSKSSSLTESNSHILSNEPTFTSNKEMMDLIYSRNQHQQHQEFASMSNVANTSEFNNLETSYNLGV